MKRITVGDYKSTPYAEHLVLQTLRKNRLTYGDLSKKLERTFADIHNVRYAILTSSGTAALRIALRALKIQHPDIENGAIAVPALTFVATLNVVLDEGFRPVLVDVDPVHYHIDPVKLEEALADKENVDIVGVLPVHLFGQPVDWKALQPLIDQYDLVSLEDSCEAMYCDVGGVPVGGLGDLAGFSMYTSHLLTTGVGGIVTTNDPKLAEDVRSIANHGLDGIYVRMNNSGNDMDVIKRRFRFKHQGFSSRITELQSAVAIPQIENWQKDVAKRRSNASKLTEILSPYADKLRLPSVRQGNTHSFMMYPIVLEEGDKWELIQHLEDNGIETREMLPLTNQPVYKRWVNEDDYPVAKFINEQGFYIGCHPLINNNDLEYIGLVFAEWFG